jgi:hypothetical protein
MEKLKRKRTINRKAGSHDLSYATTVSALAKLDMESLLISLATRSLPSVL